ncbi:MAG: MFS transporter [Labilithrix sp.]|nr:MFS transporter [Labilithrix sp.]MCW5811637.1 MFS transporter [Labilithrix sp.]
MLRRNRNFALLFAAQIVSLLGSGATTIGLALFAYRLAGRDEATALVGNALMLRILAFLVFSQPAGVLADRGSRKRILIASDVLRAALLAFMPFVTAVWHVYVVVFLLNALTAFFTPTFEASIPAVVAEEDLVRALGLSRIASDVEALASPVVAAAIVAFVGVDGVFWFDAATYLGSALLVGLVALPKANARDQRMSFRGFVRDLGVGMRIVLREPSLRQAILLSFAEATAGAGAIVVTVALVRNVLGRGETAVSLVMAAVGVGSSMMALALGRVTGRYERRVAPNEVHAARHRWGRRALLAGGLCMSAALLPIALGPPLIAVAALWSILGAGQALVAIPGSTLLAEHTSQAERGRAYAAHFALTHACWLVTYPAMGHAAVRWGAPTALTAAGATCLVVTVLAAIVRPADPRHSHA